MSEFESIGIRDFDGVEQQVGGKIIDAVFHASALPVNGIIAETADFTISSTPTDIPLIGVENYMLLDLGTNDTTSQIYIELQYRTAGDWITANVVPATTFAYRSQINGNPGNGISIRQFGSPDDTGRIVYIPCLGAVAMRIRMPSLTLAGVRVKHLVGVPATIAAITRSQRTIMPCYAFPTFLTSYADDDVIGGTIQMESTLQNSMIYHESAPRVLGFGYSDNGRGLGECDILVCNPGDITPVANGDPFEVDSPYAVLGWYEVRNTPTGDQIPLRDYGGGIKGFSLNGLDLQGEYLQNDAGTLIMADVFIVNRAGAITPTAGNSILKVVVEF